MTIIRRAEADTAARDALVLDLGDLARQGEAIIRQARERAAEIVSRANEERRRLLEGAREIGLEEGRRAGYDEGLTKGTEEGLQRAIEEAAEGIRSLTAAWTGAVEAFTRERQVLLTRARRDAVELAVEIAGRITRRAIAADPDAVGNAMESALAMVMRPTRVVVAVHPGDRERAESLLPGLLAVFPRAGDVSIASDESVERGGCVLRTAGGATIDADVSTQLDRIARVVVPGGEQP